MAYTLNQGTTQVRQLINEATADFWSDTEIQDWLNQGTMDLSTKLLCYLRESTITLNTGQMKYVTADESWIGDNMFVKYAWYKDAPDSKGLQRVTPTQWGHTRDNAAGEPKYFFEDRGAVWIWPEPSSDENTDTVYCWQASETDDFTLLSDEHQQLAIYFATGLAKAKDRKFQEATVYQQMYQNAINFERQDKFDLGIDQVNKLKLGQ